MNQSNGPSDSNLTETSKKPKFIRKQKSKKTKSKLSTDIPPTNESSEVKKNEDTPDSKEEQKSPGKIETAPEESLNPIKAPEPPKSAPPSGRRRGPNIAMIKKLAEQKQKEEEALRQLKKENEELERIRREKIEEEKRIQVEKQKEERKLNAVANKMKKMKLRNFLVKDKIKAAPKEEVKKEEEVKTDMKSPICCILGHVDTGKTKLLDKIRETDVQGGEAGGITQQIGATFFPIKDLKRKCRIEESSLPGILVIDTPGHETFANLRSRGSSLCDIAILVVDILHLLEKQTLESIELLKKRKTPFVIALNKIDRIYKWESENYRSFSESIKVQPKTASDEFYSQMEQTILKFSEVGLNTELFSRNTNDLEYINIVPTSAITGEGIPDLIATILRLSESYMTQKMKFQESTSCTILEVKEIEGFGTTIDVILNNGVLRKGDKIAVCGFEGPIITVVRSLLVPKPMKEIRVKGEYVHRNEVRASLGVKISALNLENAITGSRVLLADKDIEKVKIEVMEDLKNLISSVETKEIGVHLQSSTLGSLEALVEFVKNSHIPISSVGIGRLNKKDILKASIMVSKSKEHAVVLCFDIKVDKEIYELAESKGVKIYNERIVYNLLDKYKEYAQDLRSKLRDEVQNVTFFPCELEILPNCVFNKRSPLVLGVEVKRGILKIGTVLCVIKKDIMIMGTVTSIEKNKKAVQRAIQGEKVAIKIELGQNETPRLFGRHFEMEDRFYSLLNRGIIDNLKNFYKEEMKDDDWRLVIELKGRLDII